jgi:serine/threonine protein kinase
MAQVLLNQVGTALAYAHRKGVIHRDIKPANIMIDEDGWAIVTDFGIAKVQEAQNLTATGTAIGTPHYMSPEQFHNKTITGSSDQYSLGIVAYEMLTGKKPFDGATYAEIITQHLFEPVPDIRQLRSDLPDNVVEVVNRMMAKEPGQRFADLDAAMHALGAPATKKEGDVIRTQMISLAKSGAQKRLRMSVPMSPIPLGKTRARQVAPTAIERRPPVKKSRAGLWTALSVVGILALGGGSYAVLKFGASSSTPPAATIEQQSRPAPVVPTPLAERQGVATDSTPSVATNAPADPNAVRADSIRRAREDSIRITRAAERAAEQRLRQQQGAGARQAQTKIAPPPAPARGRSTGLATLRLILSPPASVFIDGVSKGQQSRIAEEMVPGTHTVRIERDGFATKDTVVTLGTGQIATVRIQLSQRP